MANLNASNLFNVNNMIAVVTGGGSGIGLMIANALASNGASKVYIIGRRKATLDAAVSDCPTKNMIALQGDVTDKTSLLEIASKIKDEVGYVNLVVANSGIMGPRVPIVGSIEEGNEKGNASPPPISEFVSKCLETDMQEVTNTFHVNVTGTLYTALAFLELLDLGNEKGNMGSKVSSQVVTTSSIAGFSRLRGTSFAYNASKAATTHLMKMLSTYLVPWGIRCNVLAPGLFPSELAGPLFKDKQIGMDGDRPVFAKSFIPAQRIGDEEDMAGAILYLASTAGAFCNGVVLVMDGGRLGVLPTTY